MPSLLDFMASFRMEMVEFYDVLPGFVLGFLFCFFLLGQRQLSFAFDGARTVADGSGRISSTGPTFLPSFTGFLRGSGRISSTGTTFYRVYLFV